MSTIRTLGLVVLSLTFLGCAQRPAQQPEEVIQPPAPPRVDDDARQRYQKLYPQAQIGRVIATLPDHRLVSVAEIPVAGFQAGDVLTFIGAEGPTVTGQVVNIVGNTLHVRYEEPAGSQRAPIVGDLAIRFPAGSR